eukprot:995941-Pleurochrysis_carterae.AAC.1
MAGGKPASQVVLVVAHVSAEEGANSLAQRARPEPSVQNVTSAPAPQKREFNADSSSSRCAESVAAASATFATAAEAD